MIVFQKTHIIRSTDFLIIDQFVYKFQENEDAFPCFADNRLHNAGIQVRLVRQDPWVHQASWAALVIAPLLGCLGREKNVRPGIHHRHTSEQVRPTHHIASSLMMLVILCSISIFSVMLMEFFEIDPVKDYTLTTDLSDNRDFRPVLSWEHSER